MSTQAFTQREQLSIVVVGHVDHGKSTVVGRLLADTGSLPEGKLAQIEAQCRRNARPFEYAFVLDALKDEQAQGITIDSARCFFRTSKRDYIIIDAPGHMEFLKNMVSGAARAEAALLVIDAHEGIRENSRRHGTMLSMLGVRQVVVLVNKMDLVGWDLKVFAAIEQEYRSFLARLGLEPAGFVPISARDGVNLTTRGAGYEGLCVLEHLDAFHKESAREQKPFRFPVQDIYKFTADGDERRILAGTVEAGSIRAGEEVVFYPSGKRTGIASIESFNRPRQERAIAGDVPGFTMNQQIYVRPGELMCKAGEPPPAVSSRLRASVFWMGKAPFSKGKKYKLKLATARVPVRLEEVERVIDASTLGAVEGKQSVDRHDVAECILEAAKPLAFDLASEMEATGRFVIVDNFEIAGGGIVLQALPDAHPVLEAHVAERERSWERGAVSLSEREARNLHGAKLVVLVGQDEAPLKSLARELERRLFDRGHQVYDLELSNLDRGIDADAVDAQERHEDRVRRLGELARILTDAGQIVVAALPGGDRADLDTLAALNAPQGILTVALGPSPELRADLTLGDQAELSAQLDQIHAWLAHQQILPDYAI